MPYNVDRFMSINRTANISTRIEPEVKKRAEAVLSEMGITPTEAVRLFYKQIALHKALPFDFKIPVEKKKRKKSSPLLTK